MESRLQYKRIHPIFPRILFVFFYLGMGISLHADRIFLKSGASSIGKALSVSTTHVDWQEEKNKIRKIPLAEVERIDVGYDGVPVCTNFKPMLAERCDLLLHRITKNTVSFTSKADPLKLDVLPLAKIVTLKLTFSPEEDYSLFIKPGISGIWEAGDFKGSATLVSNQNQIWVLQPKERGLASISIPFDQMKNFQLDRVQTISEIVIENGPKVIPGIAPLQDKKYTKSALLFSGAILSGLGMFYEYNQSVNAINNDREYVPSPDGRIFILSNVLSTDRYDFHNRRFQAYTALLSMIVVYSLFDAFYLGQMESQNGNTSSVWLKPGVEASVQSKQRFSPIPTGNLLHYSFEVEARF